MAKLTHFSTNPPTHNRIAHPGQLRHFMFCHAPAARRRSGGQGVRRSHRAWGVISPVSLPAGSGATLFRPRGFAHSLYRHARTCSGHDERRQGAPAPNARSCACEGGPAPDRDPGWGERLSRHGLAGGDPPRSVMKCHVLSCFGGAPPVWRAGRSAVASGMGRRLPGFVAVRIGGDPVTARIAAAGVRALDCVREPKGALRLLAESGSFRRRAGAKEDGPRTPLPSHPF